MRAAQWGFKKDRNLWRMLERQQNTVWGHLGKAAAARGYWT